MTNSVTGKGQELDPDVVDRIRLESLDVDSEVEAYEAAAEEQGVSLKLTGSRYRIYDTKAPDLGPPRSVEDGE